MKKRALSLLMAVVMVIGLLPATVRAADSTLSGKGTFAEPYLISGADELKAFRDRVNAGENPACAKLTDNIDLEGEVWTPITRLIGYLDGDGYTISNLTLKGGSYANTGLIGELNGSIVNLSVKNAAITDVGNNNNVGVLAGYIADGSTSKVDNCCVSGTITSTISGTAYIGGLVGYMTGAIDTHTALSINNCVSNVVLSGARSNFVGGLVGSAQYNSTLSITKCAQLADFGTNKGYGAGVVGYVIGGNSVEIADSYLAGTVNASSPGVIAYSGKSGNATLSLSGNFYYNKTNTGNLFQKASSWDGTVTNSSNAQKKTTDELKSLTMDGFAAREGQFGGYPVPVYTKAEPLPLPKITVSAKVEFTNTEDGTVTVTDPSGETVAP